MVLLIPFLIGIQILDVLAFSPPLHYVNQSCNCTDVKAAAEEAINKLNLHRKEGYILKLQRIFDAQKLPKYGNPLFKLALDVLETDCHVLSLRFWKGCDIRQLHRTVYGRCKVLIGHVLHSNDWNLYSFECDLYPISPSFVVGICPDCPAPGDPSEARFQNTAAETLAKFNAENKENNYFAIINVTKANLQWVVGPSNFVEYTIRETSCPKNPPVSDITQCPFLPTETAKSGLCKGSVTVTRLEKFVTVECNLFEHPVPAIDEQAPRSTSEPQEPQQSHPPPNAGEASTKQKEIVWQVIYHYPWNKPAGPEVQKPKPTSIPTIPPLEEKPSFPFLKESPQSPECPGDVIIPVPGLQWPSRAQAQTS